jgi:hypothetical protein
MGKAVDISSDEYSEFHFMRKKLFSIAITEKYSVRSRFYLV